MINELREWLRLQILKHRENLEKIYTEHKIDRAKLMSQNSYEELPKEFLADFYTLGTLVQVANFIDKSFPLEFNKTMSSTEINSLIYTKFNEEFFTWLEKESPSFRSFETWINEKKVQGYEQPEKKDVFQSAVRNMFIWAVIENTNGNKKSN